ncbi:TIGR04282 family arsenosugar biosynthesis glycosyltransferase [Raoultibacter phocaeensis]|uniref:TIGR04282 family arsenosugar biosynthesis glycosyltransferase n=1 Tax=Raoultibacter phocaeensis TaxID=2479841 RepID=UPI0015D5CEFB|nr:DUF2064 domain-containing protein [Raoultibacter phocaeensis]
MAIRKNALLLFSKPPLPGLVKTRLTRLKDGIFEPEVASGLYHCMLFDVAEICCDALAELEARSSAGGERLDNEAACIDEYELIISTTPKENVEVMQRLFDESGEWPRPIRIIYDEGASFDEHYNHAFEQVFAMGFDTILSMGADMPALPRAAVVEGFDKLHALCDVEGGGIVLSPDQEMGVSIIGWTRETPMSHDGVFYNKDGLTVLPAYIEKAAELGLPALYLPAVVDVDTMGDLFHNITLVQAIEYCAKFDDLSVPWRTAHALREMGFSEVRVPPNDLHDPREGIDVG